MWPLSEDRFRDLLGQVNAVFYADTHEPEPHALYLSSNAEHVLGEDARAHVFDPGLWWRSIHPDDLEEIRAVWEAAYRTLEPYRVDYRYVRSDGRVVWLREHAAPVLGEVGNVLHWQGVLLDVTEERAAHDQLVRAEERHRQMLEGLPAFVYVITDEVEFTNLDTSIDGAAVMGWDPDDERWRSMTWLDIVHPEDRGPTRAAWRHAIATGDPFDEEFRQVDASGDVIWVHDHAVLVRDAEGNRLHWQGMVIDVTARVAAERAARAAQHRFTTIEGQLPIIVYAVDDALAPTTLYCSPSAQEVIGVSAAAFLAGTSVFPDYLHPDDREAAGAAWERAWRERGRFHAEYRVRRDDGSTVWIRDTAERVREPGSDLAFWQGVMLDVTEERIARAELEASEASRRALVENLPAIVYEMAHDDDRRTMYISAGVESLLGYTPREWLEQPDIWAELLHPDDRETELAAHDEASRTGEPWSREYRLIAADGRVVWVRDVARLVPGVVGSTWQGVFVDITAAKLPRKRSSGPRRPRGPRRLADHRPRRGERPAGAGGRRATSRRARGPRRRGAVPPTGRGHAGRRLPMGPTRGRHERAGVRRARGSARCSATRPRSGAASTCGGTGSTRTTATGCSPRSPPARRPARRSTSEYRYLAKDGRMVWVLDRATLITRTPDGRPARSRASCWT